MTWEPADQLNCAELVQGFENKDGKQLCTVCGQLEGTDSQCDRCKKPMHHFCSHDVASQVGLEDFGDRKYCSTKCYDNTLCTTSKKLRPDQDKSAESEDYNPISSDEDTRHPVSKKQKTSASEKKAVKEANALTKKGENVATTLETNTTKATEKKAAKEAIALAKKATASGKKAAKTLAKKRIDDVGDLYIGQTIAFCPNEEKWTNHDKVKLYKKVGSNYLKARVCARKKQTGDTADLYQIRWLDSLFQNLDLLIPFETLLRGRENHIKMTMIGLNQRSRYWKQLCEVAKDDEVLVSGDLAGLEEFSEYEQKQNLPISIAEVEKIRNMRFEPDAVMSAPSDLYKHANGSTQTKLK
jgi:hypothetical protein